MPATITLRLNDQASGGLKTLQQVLEETGQVSSNVAADMDVMNAAEQRQVKVIHEHVAAQQRQRLTLVGLSADIAQVAAAYKVVQNARNTALGRDTELQVLQQLAAANRALAPAVKATAEASRAAYAVVGPSIRSGVLATSFALQDAEDRLRAFRRYALDTGMVTDRQYRMLTSTMRTLSTPFQLVYQGAAQLGTQLTKTSPAANTLGTYLGRAANAGTNLGRAGASAAVGASRLLGVLDKSIPVIQGAALGWTAFRAVLARTGRQQVDTTYDLSKATDEQRRAFEALAAEAKRSGNTVDEALLRAGQSFADFGVRVVPVYESNLDRVDAATQKLSSSIRRPLRAIASGASEVVSGLNPIAPVLREIDAAATRSTDNLVRNIEALQKLAEAGADAAMGQGYSERAKELERLEELRQRQIDDFARLRGVNANLDAELTAAAERRRLQGIETVDGIDEEIRRQRQKANELANNDEFTAEAAKQLQQTLQALEERRTAIVDDEATKRKEIEQKVRDQQQQWAEEARAEQERLVDQYIDAENRKYAEAQKMARQRAELDRGLVDTAQQEAFKNAIAAMEAQGASAADLHSARLRQIETETRQKVTAADTEEQREAALFDGQRRRMQEEGDFHRRQMQQQVEERKKKAQAELDAEKAKHDQLKALLQQSGGPTGKDLLQRQDPRAVLAALQKRRAEEAKARFRAENADDLDDGDSRSRARFRAREQAAGRQAEQQAFKEFKRGDVNPAEIANAQVEAGNATLQGLQQNGQLSQQVVQVLSQQLQTAAIEQATLAELQQQVQQLQQASNTLRDGAGRNRAQQGSLRR